LLSSVTEPYEHLRKKNMKSYFAVTGLTRSEIEYSFGTGGPLRHEHAYSILGVMRDQSYAGDIESFNPDQNFIIVRMRLRRKCRRTNMPQRVSFLWANASTPPCM
jgi:hypothetical protein